jgi:hypothetical protein
MSAHAFRPWLAEWRPKVPISPQTDAAKWLEFARRYADGIDPRVSQCERLRAEDERLRRTLVDAGPGWKEKQRARIPVGDTLPSTVAAPARAQLSVPEKMRSSELDRTEMSAMLRPVFATGRRCGVCRRPREESWIRPPVSSFAADRRRDPCASFREVHGRPQGGRGRMVSREKRGPRHRRGSRRAGQQRFPGPEYLAAHPPVERVVPESERVSREDLIAITDSCFDSLSAGRHDNEWHGSTKGCALTRRRKYGGRWFRVVAFIAWGGMCAGSCGCLLPHAGLTMRDQASQALVSKYSSAFQPGTKRTDVEDYLRANKTPFRQLCCVDGETTAFADLVQIGRNHAGWPFCSAWTVNIAFVFAGTGFLHAPDSQDVLRAGNCL